MNDLPGTEELRAAVRAVLREVLPDGVARDAAVPARAVALRTDGDLDAFVREVATQAADPARRAELQTGRHGYRLAAGPAEVPAAEAGVVRVEHGAVTERTVRRAAAAGARLVVGRRAVLTPLARDRARALGVEVEKEMRD